MRLFGSLRAAPLPMGAAVLCVALGIGATTVVFSAVHAALLRPPPFPEPDRLVSVLRTTPFFQSGPFAPANFLDLRAAGAGLESLSAMTPQAPLLQDVRGSHRLTGWQVSTGFFEMLGVGMVAGRGFQPEDERVSAGAVALISEELWRTRFGGAPDIVDRSIRLDGVEHQVVGVLPAGFELVHVAWKVGGDVWTPLRFTPDEASQRRSNYLMLVGRLARGTSLEAADEAMRARMGSLVDEHPELTGEQLRVVGLQAESASRVRTPLLALMGAVVLVLLIAAVDLAALLLVRGESRRREWAVRRALGAGRATAVSAAVRESLEITGLGAALGMALAWVGIRTVERQLPGTLPQLDAMRLDPRVLALGLGIAVLVGTLAAAVPALQASSTHPGEALRSGRHGQSGGRRQNRLLRALVTGEVALSFVLLVGAGLLTRDFARLLAVDPGFDPGSLLTLQVTVPVDGYGEGGSTRDGFLVPALDALRALPGVQEAGTVSMVPYVNWGNNFNVRYEGQAGDDPATLPLVESRWADNGYFQALDLELTAGRFFQPADLEAGAPVVVVANQALADRDFPGASALGRRYHLSDTTFATIVGVVSNVQNAGPFSRPRPEVYRPVPRNAATYPLVVETDGDPASMAGAVRAALLQAEPDVALGTARPMTRVMADALGAPRFYLLLMTLFAGTALVLALSGLYGLVSYVVATRTRELGIRIALGSSPARTRGLVLRQGLAMVGLGLLLGTAGAVGVSRTMESLMHGLSPLDPVVWLTMPAGFLLVTGAALLVPALRAQRVDPARAMRVE